MDAIRQRLEALLNSFHLGVLSSSQNNLEIRIYQKESDPDVNFGQLGHETISSSPFSGSFSQTLKSTLIKNSSDTLVSLNEFVNIEHGTGLREIQATRLGESFIFPVKEITPEKLDRLRETLSAQNNFTFFLSGPYFDRVDRLKELVWVLFVALLLLFMILSAQFESIILPFVILLTIPFGIAGSVLFLYLGGQSISILAMIGIVVMTGIMVNDAILKLDMIVRLRNDLGERQAIYEAGKRRIKPIFMTSITTVLAVVPILFGSGLGAELQSPFTWALIGGITVGTFSSILLLPLIYLAIGRLRK